MNSYDFLLRFSEFMGAFNALLFAGLTWIIVKQLENNRIESRVGYFFVISSFACNTASLLCTMSLVKSAYYELAKNAVEANIISEPIKYYLNYSIFFLVTSLVCVTVFLVLLSFHRNDKERSS